jgi:hypothetical protein
MKFFIRFYLFVIIILFSNGSDIYTQISFCTIHDNYQTKIYLKETSPSSIVPITAAFATGLYLINPIILLENRKLYAGITKEFSVGFGKLGEHRLAVEYSFIFAGSIAHHLRFSYKYDILLKNNLKPSHMIQGTSVISPGVGYFTDFKGSGVFPEISYGYSLRNHKLLFFPYFKLRHTFMITKNKPDITDFSFGIIFGIANPFIDVKIRRGD